MRLGIIGDLHEPFTHPRYFDFIKGTFKNQGIEKVIFIGDIEAYAMAYAKPFPLKPTLGCGIVINGLRGCFMPMEFPKYARR